ncbi:MAG: helix-turn-helix transcriptional regulator [Clostridia bacterium]|nr:helix-turn-helix transcriptional regulator [Clostridia bacterium]
MNQVTTGKFIALKRKEKNLTQEQLAEKLGVSDFRDFISGLFLGLSIVEMLIGIYVLASTFAEK